MTLKSRSLLDGETAGPWAARALLLALVVWACFIAFLFAVPSFSKGADIVSSGPLTFIETTPDLGCAVDHEGDTHGEFYGETACGTLVAVDGSLYGPADIPAGSSASPRTSWQTESQVMSGSGTSINPYRIVTIVSGGGLRLTQTDTYVVGSESYGTRISVENTTATPKSLILYRAADCYLQNSDYGYGRVDPASGAIACVAEVEPDSRIEQWAPLTPGSHYYETFYNTLWSHLGSQQSLPDTCDCDSYEDNSAGLSWAATVPAGSAAAFSHLTAFSPTGETVEDSDGDGFPDSWEEPSGGVDTNGDGTPDLKLSDYGATPDKPDVFVQVNWTRTRSCFLFFCSTRNRRPSLAALRDVQEAFDEHGIRLHIDAGPSSLMNPDTGATWGSRSRPSDSIEAPATIPGLHGTSFDWNEAFQGYRNQLLSSARSRIFHFALYVGNFDSKKHTGLARDNSPNGAAGRDFMLAYDAFRGNGPTRLQEASTFMHELGHNLGLSHGGSWADRFVNFKPNYPSVMNYDWQLSGTYKYSQLGLLDYSDGTLEPIDEHSLSEEAGLDPDSAASDIATKWWCPDGHSRGPSPSALNVDWNCNGHTDGGTISANLNGPDNSDLQVLRDFDDWSSLVFDGGGALGGAGDPISAPESTEVDEPESSVLYEAAGEENAVQLDSPGQLTMQSNTSAPITLTITNRHDEARHYSLAVHGEGVALSGLPTSVDLAANETRSLNSMLESGSARDDAFFEVNASSDNPADADSAVSEVFVVDFPVSDEPGQFQTPSGVAQSPPGAVSASAPSGNHAKRIRCRHGFKRKVTKGKVRCVRKHKRHKHRHRHRPELSSRRVRGGR